MGVPTLPVIHPTMLPSAKPGNPPPMPTVGQGGVATPAFAVVPEIKKIQDQDVANFLKEAPDGLVQLRCLATMMTNTAIDLAVEGRLVGAAMDAALAATKIHSVVLNYTHQKMPTSPDEYGSSEQIADNLKAMERRLLADRDSLLDEVEEAEVV